MITVSCDKILASSDDANEREELRWIVSQLENVWTDEGLGKVKQDTKVDWGDDYPRLKLLADRCVQSRRNDLEYLEIVA